MTNGFQLHHITREPLHGSRGRPPMLVLLHGLRSNEQDLMGLAPQLDDRFFIVSARAPLTLGPGAYGWYHVEFTESGYVINEDEAEASRTQLIGFVDELTRNYPVDPDRIFLMGFSQGCIMSIGAALAAPRKLAGVVGMSGRLLERTLVRVAPHEQLTDLPVMVVHGLRDTVIPIDYGRQMRDELSRLPVDLTYREYDMSHQVSSDSLRDIAGWLTTRLDLPGA